MIKRRHSLVLSPYDTAFLQFVQEARSFFRQKRSLPLAPFIADGVRVVSLAADAFGFNGAAMNSSRMLLEFEDDGEDERKAHIAALEHLSRTSMDTVHQGKVLVLTATDRNVRRYREEGRFSNSPDTKQQHDMARLHATQVPVLVLLRQNGRETDRWRDLPFWWPVIVTPDQAITSVFASATPGTP